MSALDDIIRGFIKLFEMAELERKNKCVKDAIWLLEEFLIDDSKTKKDAIKVLEKLRECIGEAKS